jgi:hypothetical protein
MLLMALIMEYLKVRSRVSKDATAEQQVMWGLKYIDNRYGSPCKAWDILSKE